MVWLCIRHWLLVRNSSMIDATGERQRWREALCVLGFWQKAKFTRHHFTIQENLKQKVFSSRREVELCPSPDTSLCCSLSAEMKWRQTLHQERAKGQVYLFRYFWSLRTEGRITHNTLRIQKTWIQIFTKHKLWGFKARIKMQDISGIPATLHHQVMTFTLSLFRSGVIMPFSVTGCHFSLLYANKHKAYITYSHTTLVLIQQTGANEVTWMTSL